jgi:hypothetical protein
MERNIDLVMLVDDNDTDNFISKRIIEITKFAKRIEIKNSGKSALEYLEREQDNPISCPISFSWTSTCRLWTASSFW